MGLAIGLILNRSVSSIVCRQVRLYPLIEAKAHVCAEFQILYHFR